MGDEKLQRTLIFTIYLHWKQNGICGFGSIGASRIGQIVNDESVFVSKVWLRTFST